MDHLEAIQSKAAERYALHQLSAVESEAFEEHFFSCTECAEEVRWVTMFESNAKKVVGQKVRETSAEFVALVELSTSTAKEIVLAPYAKQLILAIPLPEGWKAQHVSLATGAGTARFTMAVPAEQVEAGKVMVAVAAKELDPGQHLVTIVTPEGDYLEYPFHVRLA